MSEEITVDVFEVLKKNFPCRSWGRSGRRRRHRGLEWIAEYVDNIIHTPKYEDEVVARIHRYFTPGTIKTMSEEPFDNWSAEQLRDELKRVLTVLNTRTEKKWKWEEPIDFIRARHVNQTEKDKELIATCFKAARETKRKICFRDDGTYHHVRLPDHTMPDGTKLSGVVFVQPEQTEINPDHPEWEGRN